LFATEMTNIWTHAQLYSNSYILKPIPGFTTCCVKNYQQISDRWWQHVRTNSVTLKTFSLS